jgi:Smr domain-containing protein
VIRRPLQHALDELRFGRNGTLNLRASLPTAAEAVKRTESWLRMKQAEGAREVLVVTGRGNQSFARVPVVREAVRRLLSFLSTRGVVADHSEHSPGSFAVRLLPLNASMSRAASGTGPAAVLLPLDPPTLDGLSPDTLEQLRILASGTLQALGVRDPSPAFIEDEMQRQCAQLAATLPGAATADAREVLLRASITRAIERLDDDQR